MGANQCGHVGRLDDGDEAYASPPPVEPVRGGVAKLMSAAARGQSAEVERLLKKGIEANVTNYDQRAPLHVAAAEGQSEVVELLIAARADVSAKDRWGHTPTDEAKQNGSNKVVELLRRAGAPDEEDSDSLDSLSELVVPGSSRHEAAMLLCCAAAAASVQALEDLHSKGKDLNAGDYDGRTALHVACAHGHGEVVDWLLRMGANMNVSDSFGLTPLAQATRSGHSEVCKKLVAMGAEAMDINEVRLSADTGLWAIPSSEIEIGPVLSKTLKSMIYRATWRGLPVVAKTTNAMIKSISGKSLVDMAHAEDTMTPGWGQNRDEAAQEAIHEIRLLSTLRHPDLVMFLGACFDHKTPFFITEFMEGGDLERYYMAKARRLGHPYAPSGAKLMKWASSVARALSFLHGCTRPIIHRDLKPLNLLLNRSEDLKVADFGISKLMAPKRLGSQGGGCNGVHAKPEMSGGIGTWRYMAPEVVRYEQYTDRVDVYSFALILWFMSTGRQPFVKQFGSDAELVLKEYIKGNEPRPEMAPVRGSQAFKQLMEDCWNPAPSVRPSAYECTQRLAAMCAREGAGPLVKLNDKFSNMFGRQRTA